VWRVQLFQAQRCLRSGAVDEGGGVVQSNGTKMHTMLTPTR
jgi:hypothetical protein